jgi:hypothetical protein
LNILITKEKTKEACWGLLACGNMLGKTNLDAIKELKNKIDSEVLWLLGQKSEVPIYIKGMVYALGSATIAGSAP